MAANTQRNHMAAMCFRYVRIQQGGYGSNSNWQNNPDFKDAGFGRATDDLYGLRAPM